MLAGEAGPLYWIFGKERYLVDRAVAVLKDKVLEPATRDFNYDALQAREAGVDRILSTARTLPMMARRRFVLVREADVLEAKDLERFLPYIAAPAPETCLVFVAEKADQRLKFFTAFKKQGVLLKLDQLTERQLPGFVRQELVRRGLRSGPGAAEMLVAEVGADLGQMVDAIERLQLYLGSRKEMRVEDVEEVVTSTRIRSVFELSDGIGEGNLGRAMQALGSLLKAREPALRILAMIARQVRLLLQTRSAIDEKVPKGRLLETLGLPPFVVDKLLEQARRFDAPSLLAMHRAVYQTDRALKSSRLSGDRWLERLVLELVSRRGGAPGSAGSGRMR